MTSCSCLPTGGHAHETPMKHALLWPCTIAALTALAHGSSAWGQCSNDAGTGDTAEGEVCPADLYEDTTNSGCNASPPVFTDVAADGGLPRTYCGSASTYKVIRLCDEDGDCPDMLCVGDPNPGDGVDEASALA